MKRFLLLAVLIFLFAPAVLGRAFNESTAAPAVPAAVERSAPTAAPLVIERFASRANPAAIPSILPTPTRRAVTRPIATTQNSIPVTGEEDARPERRAVATEAALIPENWKRWPVVPTTLRPELVELYRWGIANGNNPRAVSMLGDCQSEPDIYWGAYESDLARRSALPEMLQQTLANFGGSFDRKSPTVKSGSTSGSMLFALWNDNPEGKCEPGETPLTCELRTHRPSIVIIHLGTHWEARNERYMVKIIEQILDHGAIPVLGTKGDNLEMDESLNREVAELAARYGIPMWNFWAAIQDLPGGGIVPGKGMYLTEDALELQRYTALQALDAVWQMTAGE